MSDLDGLVIHDAPDFALAVKKLLLLDEQISVYHKLKAKSEKKVVDHGSMLQEAELDLAYHLATISHARRQRAEILGEVFALCGEEHTSTTNDPQGRNLVVIKKHCLVQLAIPRPVGFKETK